MVQFSKYITTVVSLPDAQVQQNQLVKSLGSLPCIFLRGKKKKVRNYLVTHLVFHMKHTSYSSLVLLKM